MTVEEVLAKRNDVSTKCLNLLKERAQTIGLEVVSGGVKDITFPADVKKIFAQVAQAEKSGQASLTKARAEVASLRALANAAKMIEGNPNLLALRTLQSMSELATTTGNTIVLGLPPSLMPIPGNGKKHAPGPESSSDE
jgi:regulator of protease activity HflC (stomatin/prohibitin superfamily)